MVLSKTGRFLSKAVILGVGVFSPLSIRIPLTWYKARIPGFPRKSIRKEQVVFSGEGRRDPKVSLALGQPKVAPVQVWVALEQETFLGLSGPRPKRLLAPFLIDFRGNPGIRALYQASSLWNLAAIQRFPGSFPNFPGSSPNFPGSSRTSPEVSPFLWEA